MNEPEPETTAAQTDDSPLAKLGWWCLGWIPIFAGFVVCVWPSLGAPWTVALPAGFLACWGGAVILHELGHLIAARLLRLNPFSVLIGHGPTLWEGKLLGVNWTLNALPASGWVRVWPMPSPLLRLRMLVMVGAGPGANAVLAWLAATLIWAPPVWWMRIGPGDSAFPILLPLFLCNGWAFLSALNPNDVKSGGLTHSTDGLQIIRLLRGSHPTVVGASGKTPMASMSESDPSGGWQKLAESGKGLEMLQLHTMLLKQKGIPEDIRFQLLDGFATGVLIMGLTDRLAEADRYSEELFRMRPDEWTVKGTRGSVLIEMGELEAGMKLLLEVVENDPVAFDRGIAAAYLALAEIKRGERGVASDWLVKARGFDPQCVPLKRFEKMLNNP